MLTAIILAAGESKRMGQPKVLLPWGKSTVLQTIIATLQKSGLDDVLVVTGSARAQVEALVGKSAQTVYNQNYANEEMLASIQIGLKTKIREASAALICLGDQPQIQERNVRALLEARNQHRAGIVVPSYEKKRGHPWLVAREYWEEIINLPKDQTMRDFFNAHKRDIFHVNADTPVVLQDLDTPEDYLKFKPQA